MRESIKKISVIGPIIKELKRYLFPKKHFPGSREYWSRRYAKGGNSGAGSYGKRAKFKAEVINSFIAENNIKSVIEFGCGNGNQLKLAQYPKYLGFDVSPKAISLCKKVFYSDPSKHFNLLKDYHGEKADLILSLDVIFHLIEDDVFESHMKQLYKSCNKFVIIYSSNTDKQLKQQAAHIRHRKLTKWVDENMPDWKLIQHIPNKYPLHGRNKEESRVDFYIYKKIS